MAMDNVLRIAQKELSTFFSSLTAFIFFGAFLGVTLFIFFWVETFFARNIADVRPLFDWMPVLMIFLVPALTMRMWSEERRSGTLEFLMTVPVSNFQLVAGKFVACLFLIVIALALTLPIPISVAFLGPLDWGPVIGGYIASVFLAASYTAIGLYISTRTDNQIVSLILSTFVCGLFWLIGADVLTALFNNNVGETMKLLGSGSRFQAITRGVIDFRDLYYYLSITAVFLGLNVLELERLRWSANHATAQHKRWLLITALTIANFVAGNLWLQQIGWARVDLTAGQIYTISDATRNYLAKLKEPLVIRGYFSKKTHPLLAPLVPRLRDLLKEYAIAGKGKVHVEFVDPLERPDLEREANEKYGIKPLVFQSADKYQAALTNSYFDLLVKYGDQFEKLSFRDLTEVKARGEKDLEADLRNPEYDITNAIKKVLYGYQGTGNIFDQIEEPVTFVGYISPDDKLPRPLADLKSSLKEVLAAGQKRAAGKLSVEFVDPDTDGGKVAKKLGSEYGFKPMALSLVDPKTFWFYMTLKRGDQLVEVPLPEDLKRVTLTRNINAGLKRFSKGFLKTVGIYYLPPADAQIKVSWHDNFSALRAKLGGSYTLKPITLGDGRVPPDVDLLLVLAPEFLTSKQAFAIDQFLMKGGTAIVVTAPFDIGFGDALRCRRVQSGLEDLLKHYGIDVQKTMVLDPQNFPLPIPVGRKVNGYTVQETQLAPFPYFVDVRRDGMSADDRLTAGVNQVTVTLASPIALDKELNKERHVEELLQSSPGSWTSNETDIQPNYNIDQRLGFPAGKDLGRKLLAVALEGSFDSVFKDKGSPLIGSANERKVVDAKKDPETKKDTQTNEPPINTVIGKSPDSARLIVFASNSFLTDKMLYLETTSIGSHYLNPLEFIENTMDWSLADRELLTIRGRGHFVRTLKAMDPGFQRLFEYANYLFALIGLLIVWFIRRHYRLKAQKRYQSFLRTLAKPTDRELKPENGNDNPPDAGEELASVKEI